MISWIAFLPLVPLVASSIFMFWAWREGMLSGPPKDGPEYESDTLDEQKKDLKDWRK